MLRKMGRGDRHPVLVMPGFTASDQSTAGLRYLIRSWGYWAHGWGLGANVGPTAGEAGRHPRPPRGAAQPPRGPCEPRRLEPRWPLRPVPRPADARDGPQRDHARLAAADDPRRSQLRLRHRRPLQHLFDPAFIEMADYERGPLPVPSTAVYTRTDGVVRWQVCLDVADDTHENVEVRGSHSGLGFNPTVIYVIADRLGQSEDGWRPFQPPLPCARSTRSRPASRRPVRLDRPDALLSRCGRVLGAPSSPLSALPSPASRRARAGGRARRRRARRRSSPS